MEPTSSQSSAADLSNPLSSRASDSAPLETEGGPKPEDAAPKSREKPLVPGLAVDFVASFTEMSIVESKTPAKSHIPPTAGLNTSTASVTPIKLLTKSAQPGLFAVPTTPLSAIRPAGRATSTPFSMRSTAQCSDEEIIDLDVSQTVDDEQLQNSVQMKSLRKSLAKSGLLILEEPLESTPKYPAHPSASPGMKVEFETEMSVDGSQRAPPSAEEEVPLVEDSCEVNTDGSATSSKISSPPGFRLSES
ncbi:unnamed protein product, partial [Dibothriocephalus latus]